MITLVSTVFNDNKGIRDFLASMAKQTKIPDEIVIVDAGSNDGTWETISRELEAAGNPWKLVAALEPGCNVARGRNLAISKAKGDIIVSTDIGCFWEPEWLAELVAPLEADSSIELVVGSWAVRKEGLEGEWAQTEWALKGNQSFSAGQEIACSSRSVAYRKCVWKAVGGYPEDLTLAADDAVFNCLLKQAGVLHAPAPVIRCYWHRHSTLKGYLKEQYRYGIGDGEAAIRRQDVFMTGSRMLLEIVGILAVVPVIIGTTGIRIGGLVFIFLALSSFAVRFKRLLPARKRLASLNIQAPLSKLLKLVYLSKIYWLAGYGRGYLRGSRTCRACRERLATMSPGLYRGNLGH